MRTIAVIFAALLPLGALAAGPATRPGLVTLRARDVSPRAVVEGFNRQCALQLELPDEQALAAKVSVDIAGLPPMLALHELCAALSASPSAGTGVDTLELHPDQSFARKPFAASGPLLVVADRISHSRSVHASGLEADSSFEMSLTAFIDPSIRVLAYRPRVRVREAMDERGNSLAVRTPDSIWDAGGGVAGPDAPSASIIEASLTLSLAYPPQGAGRRIARLKGGIVADVLSRWQRWELDGHVRAAEQARSVGGVRYVVRGISRQRGTYRVELALHREAATDEQWRRLHRLTLPVMLRLLDEEGRALRFAGIEEQIMDDRSWHLTLAYATAEAQPGSGPPTKLVWDLPVEVKEMELPFELRDVPMP